MNNLRTFRVLLGTTFAPLVGERLIGNVRFVNEAPSNEVHISTDGGTNFAVIPGRGLLALERVDLAAMQVKSNVVNTPLSVFFLSS